MVTHMKCYKHEPYYGCAAFRQTVLTGIRQRCQNSKSVSSQAAQWCQQQFILTVFMQQSYKE